MNGNRELHVDYPAYAIGRQAYPVSGRWNWTEASTFTAPGVEHGRGPIVDERIRVVLPVGYVGAFEVHLYCDDGTRCIAVEGWAYAPIEEP